MILPSESRTAKVNGAIAEYLEAIERRSAPDREVFLERYAELRGDLEEFLDDYRALERLSPRSPAGAAGNPCSAATNDFLRAAGPRLELPCSLGNFELLEEIARGGMGIVYKARQRRPERIVALKMILAGQLASPADLERFRAEAQAAAALDHPRIVPIFEVGEWEGQHYYTMGYVDGPSLAERLERGSLPAREAAAILRDVALAVHHAHEQGVVHRDLKPANMLLDPRSGVRVADFGLAKRQTDESGLTCSGQLLGTPSFMSPEQVSGKIGPVGTWSDVYSLGATLYALVSGRPPFQAASTVDTLKQVLDHNPVPLRQIDVSIPRDLETISLKCLEKSAHHRYCSALALADDLPRFLTDKPIVARRSAALERAWRWCRRNPTVALLSGILLSLLLTLSIAGSLVALRQTALRRDADEALAQKAQLVDRLAESLTAHDHVHLAWLASINERWEDAGRHFENGARVFEKLIADHPDQDGHYYSYLSDALLQLSGIHIVSGNHPEAERAARRCEEILLTLEKRRPLDRVQTRNLMTVMGRRALVRLDQGDIQAYRQVRDSMIHRFAAMDDEYLGYALTWFAGMADDDPDAFLVPLKQARRTLEHSPRAGHYLTALGILLYRFGQLDEAERYLLSARDAYAIEPLTAGNAVFSRLYLAMIHARRGDTPEAEHWFASAEEEISTGTKSQSIDRLPVEIIHKEARRLLAEHRATAPLASQP